MTYQRSVLKYSYMLMTQKYIVIRNQGDQQKLQSMLNLIKKVI